MIKERSKTRMLNTHQKTPYAQIEWSSMHISTRPTFGEKGKTHSNVIQNCEILTVTQKTTRRSTPQKIS
jgi:hypothetical protein